MKTFVAKSTDIEKKWYLVDAEGKTLGRLATRIAEVLRGKNKPIFTPNIDCGDFVIVINAEKVAVTGDKLNQKEYYRHSGYPGGFKKLGLEKALADKPEFVIEHAVKGMLPKGRLGRSVIGKLKVYRGAEHPHEAQQPEALKFD